MLLIKKARTGTGCFIQIIGGIFWVGNGLCALILTALVLLATFGAWAIIAGLLLAPLTYLAAVPIVWFSAGVFPVVVLFFWLASWIGFGVMYLGSLFRGEEA